MMTATPQIDNLLDRLYRYLNNDMHGEHIDVDEADDLLEEATTVLRQRRDALGSGQ